MIKLKHILIITPLLMGFLGARLFPMPRNAGQDVASRPPRKWFSIVWTALYLMLGIFWFLQQQKHEQQNIVYLNVSVLLLLGLFMTWQYLFSAGKKKGALAILVGSVVAVTVIRDISPQKINGIPVKTLLVPLFVWLLYATVLSMFSLQEQQMKSKVV